MPVYEYVCLDCEAKFEKRRNIGDNDDDIVCPECGVPAPKRQFSVFCSVSSSSGGSGIPHPSGGGG